MRLAFQADAIPSFAINSGNEGGYFSITAQGQLILAQDFIADSDQGFELEVAITLAGASTITRVKINVIASERFVKLGVL